MPAKKIILTGLVTLLGVGGLVTGAFLIRQRQSLTSDASVPGGRAEVSLLPAGGSFDTGQTVPVSVYFNTDGVSVSGVKVRVTYRFSSGTPEVVASNVEINPTLLASGNWSCPTKTVDEDFGNVNIDISCADFSASGFSSTSDTLLATFDLQINSIPSIAPFTIRFDASNSVITQKNNGQDILGIPESTGSYTVGGVVPTSGVPTATPFITTAPGVTVTETPIATPTSVFATATPTVVASSGSATLPDAGVGSPTTIALILGMIALFGSLAFAL